MPSPTGARGSACSTTWQLRPGLMKEEGRAEGILILDLDVHQGNGTALIFRDVPRGIHPLHPRRQQLPLPKGTQRPGSGASRWHRRRALPGSSRSRYRQSSGRAGLRSGLLSGRRGPLPWGPAGPTGPVEAGPPGAGPIGLHRLPERRDPLGGGHERGLRRVGCRHRRHPLQHGPVGGGVRGPLDAGLMPGPRLLADTPDLP